jgi:hypothetical protein
LDFLDLTVRIHFNRFFSPLALAPPARIRDRLGGDCLRLPGVFSMFGDRENGCGHPVLPFCAGDVGKSQNAHEWRALLMPASMKYNFSG